MATLPNARRSARSILLQGIPDPVTAAVRAPAPGADPKRVSPRTLDHAVTRLPYHTPTPPRPAPRPSAKAQQVAARAKARQMVNKGVSSVASGSTPPATVGPALADKLGGAAAGITQGAQAATGGAAVQAPTPVPTPVPTPTPAPAPQANAADPYADLPPEVAALLHAHDAQTNAQANALQGYYGQQSTAAQAFAQQIASQLTGLGQMAGISAAPGAGVGVPGALASLAPQLSQIGQKLTGAQGFDIANAAAMTPTFLQQSGQGALAGLYGAAQKGTSDVLQQTAQSQGDFAVQQLKGDQAAQSDARQAVMDQAKNAISANNAQLGFLGRLLSAAIASGNTAQTNQVRQQISQIQADTAQQVAQIRADASTNVAGINATSRETVAKNKTTAAAKKAGKGKPAAAGTRTAIANAFDRIWSGDPGNFVTGIAPATDGSATPEENAAATTATINFLRRYHDNFPGHQGLAQLLALMPPDAQKLAQQWFKGQTGGDLKKLKKIWP